jgi:23S rRNA pseudouridine1911/1915/1917 synthase
LIPFSFHAAQHNSKHSGGQAGENIGSVLISGRGIYAASPFKAIMALKRAKARAPSKNRDTAKLFSPCLCDSVAIFPSLEKLFEIIFEDADLLVVNKPAGLVCHPTKNGEMSSLIGRARLHLGFSREDREVREENKEEAKPSPPSRSSCDDSELKIQSSKLKTAQPHLINRLDRETSGVVLIAKNSAAAGELGKILESRAIEKEYLAIVHGHVAAEQGTIDAPLGKDEQSVVAVKDCIREDGAASQTEFFVERRFSRAEENFTLLRIVPRTGRKHQIRIHLAHIGHPIVGDKLYGGDEDIYMALVQNRLTPEQRAKLIFENHALHARSIEFLWRGQPVEFSCEPEPWFTDF